MKLMEEGEIENISNISVNEKFISLMINRQVSVILFVYTQTKI